MASKVAILLLGAYSKKIIRDVHICICTKSSTFSNKQIRLGAIEMSNRGKLV